MRPLTLQERTILMTQLRDRAKAFLSVEGDPFDHCHISMQESGEKILDVIIDCHADERRDKIKVRLQSFGFPNANNAPVRLVFTNPEYQPITSLKAKEEEGNLADQTVTDEIFDLVQKHFKDRGWKNLVVKGSGFIRVQGKDMARKAATQIKTLSTKAKPFCAGEDVILYPKSITQPVNIDSFMEYLKQMIGGVFGFTIMDPIRDGNSVIIGFSDEKELNETKFCVTLFGLQEPRQLHQTLIFLPEEPSVGIDEVRSEWNTPGQEQQRVSEILSPVHPDHSTETVSRVSPDEFKKDVRQFLKTHSIQRVEKGTMREVEDFHYQIAIPVEYHETMIALAKKEHPEWLLEKSERGESTFNFFHSTYYHHKEKSQSVVKKEIPENSLEPLTEGKGLEVTLKAWIDENLLQEIIKKVPDSFLTKEAQERGLFSSRKEILDTLTEEERAILLLSTTSDELVAEVKRRGSEFVKQLVMNLL